jgi:hypothetical protein
VLVRSLNFLQDELYRFTFSEPTTCGSPIIFLPTNNLITWAIDRTDRHHVVHRVIYVYAYAHTRYCTRLYTYTYMIARRSTGRVTRTTTRASQSPSCHGSRSPIYHDTLAIYANNVTLPRSVKGAMCYQPMMAFRSLTNSSRGRFFVSSSANWLVVDTCSMVIRPFATASRK